MSNFPFPYAVGTSGTPKIGILDAGTIDRQVERRELFKQVAIATIDRDGAWYPTNTASLCNHILAEADKFEKEQKE